MLDVASSRLGVSVVDTANAISCGDVHVVSYSNEKFEYKKLDKDKLKSGPDPKVIQYVQSESKPTCTTDVSVFAIDDVAITGVKSEMDIQSLKDIRADSTAIRCKAIFLTRKASTRAASRPLRRTSCPARRRKWLVMRSTC